MYDVRCVIPHIIYDMGMELLHAMAVELHFIRIQRKKSPAGRRVPKTVLSIGKIEATAITVDSKSAFNSV